MTTGHAITGDVTAGHVEGARGTRGLRQRRLLSGIGAQVGLARRESPSRGSQSVRLALRLVHEMPHTLAALEAGHISEWRATIIARETAELGPSERAMVDAEVSGGLGVPGDPVGSLGDRELARRVRAAAYHADPDSVLARSARAEGDRRVTLRPAPDTMAYVTALLPVAQAVSVHAALRVAAASALAAGDARSAGQVMADEVVTRVTGQERAQDVSVEVQLVMTDRALFAGDEVCAQLPGYGTVPAAWARRLLVGAGGDPGRRGAGTDGRAGVRSPSAESKDDGIGNGVGGDPGGPADLGNQTVEGQDLAGVRRARVWLRRLYADPTASDLVAMDSSRRTFDGGLRRFLIARDGGICRTPWCDAPIRHIDHVEDHADGGATSAENGQGLCVRCNHSKQQSGWRAWRAPSTRGRPGGHRVATTTPTGHRYESVAPPLILGHPPDPRSPLERRLEKLLAAG